VLDEATRRTERVLLETRLRSGLPVDVLDEAGRKAAHAQVDVGLVEPEPLRDGRVVLTGRGRLLADAVVRDLVSW
jgi:oxygen-independent coproporphyrinogen-3 oxidase